MKTKQRIAIGNNVYRKKEQHTFVVVEKLFGKDGNVERTDLVSGSVGAVTSGIVTPITVLLLLVLLPGLHVLYNVQLRVVALNLLNVLLRLDLAVRRVRCRLLL